MKTATAVLLLFIYSDLFSQENRLQFFRPYDQRGIHVFETTKADTVPFNGLHVKVGGSFAQNFQALDHQNKAVNIQVDSININELMPINPGFNLAMANLYVDAQLADGIRLNLSMYLSTRHHKETWVKAGYIQFDKLTFLNSPLINRLMENLTIRVGDIEVDYGDQHFRRSDGGNVMYNPFIENYIIDAFTTEIGGELYYHSRTGILAMAGLTNGQLNPTVLEPSKIDSATGRVSVYTPAFHGKIGYDRQLSPDFRMRLTGSAYYIKSAPSNSLFFGDRAGSQYFYVMENTTASSDDNAWSGRINPLFTQEVTAVMINPFIKWKGFEFFGTLETSAGRLLSERKTRTFNQYAAELIARFPESEKFWIGGRYNMVRGSLPSISEEVTVARITASAGWFIAPNIMAKAEYVVQNYLDFPLNDIRSDAQFEGWMVQAAVGF